MLGQDIFLEDLSCIAVKREHRGVQCQDIVCRRPGRGRFGVPGNRRQCIGKIIGPGHCACPEAEAA